MAGLPATGKSTLAQALADKLSGTILSKDDIRQAIFAVRDIAYSTEQDDFCMEIMLQVASYLLKKDRDRFIFLDGRTFSQRYQIDRVIEFANRNRQPWRILECTCAEATAKARLNGPAGHPASNRDYLLYLEIKRQFEEITLPRLVLNTDTPLDECAALALQFLKS